MDNQEVEEGALKPTPLPRSRGSPKPTPLPRNKKTPRLYPTLTKFTQELREEEEEEDVAWGKIPDKQSLQQNDPKRTTINIFKLATTLNDPFDDFDTEFDNANNSASSTPKKEEEGVVEPGRVLSAISFTSPLNELDEKTRQRFSTFSSLSSASTTDDSDHYMEPPPARPVSVQIAANLSKSVHNGSVKNFKRKQEKDDDEDTKIFTPSHIRAVSCPVAPLALEEDQEYEPIEQLPPVLPNTLPPNLNFVENNKRITFPNFLPQYDNSTLGSYNKDKFDTLTSTSDFGTWGQGSRRSVASDTESTHSFQFDRTSSQRSSSASSSRKKVHEYDDVTIEDGTVVVLDSPRFSDDTNNNSSSTNSRDSVIAEFDPLVTPPLFRPVQEETQSNNLDHRYEFIDTDAEDGRSSCSNNEDVSMEERFPVDFKLNFTPPSSPLDEEEYEAVEPPLPPTKPPTDEPPSPPPPSKEVESPPAQPSFFRRFSSKFRLNAIREERIDGVQCKKCRLEHPDSSKCKYVPSYRENVVYSTNLFKSGGLGRKEWVKKRVVLAKGKLAFYNDKSEVVWELPLEKIAKISKKDGPGTLKYFELGLVHWKNSTLVLAGANEAERGNWMMKYVEAHTTSFPPVVTSSFDRGGWCFIKETVTSDWRPGWLILRDRTLFYSNHNSEEYFEMDLRKARSIVVGGKEEEQRSPWADNSEVLTLDLICRILYIQTESSKITQSWEKAIRNAATSNGPQFHEMQLTLDDVPVIVDKCIDFLYAHGTLAEGIYRQSGANSRISQLMAEFQKDAWNVQISKDFSAHDVAGTLKRFFRTLPEPLVTSNLYPEWIRATNMRDTNAKNVELIRLLETLPPINYNIMKRLMCHLYAVHELHEKNLMPLMNLAAIWGPTLMNVDGAGPSYDAACAESELVKELIEGYYTLFRVKEEERERERKMQDALEKFHLGSLRRKCSGDMKIWIYLWEKDEASPINLTLTPYSTGQGIVSQILSQSNLMNSENVSVHEVICSKGLLERPLHPMEKVVETVLRWSIWEEGERKNNFLILKKNTVYPQLLQYTKESQKMLGAEVRWADSRSKSFRKAYLQLSLSPSGGGGGCLKLFKDSKCLSEQGSWKVEELVWYLGCEAKRQATPPTMWTLTLVKKTYPFKRTKEEPFFGSVVCLNSEEELHRCLGALVLATHPEGLYPSVFL